ncbi:MAG: ATP-binding protein [Desulfocapsaceae bacterium]|jgi:PAS domain S-box-containing protein|nr:ATP-binding protein [Desulfocapsaceae bacterium]
MKITMKNRLTLAISLVLLCLMGATSFLFLSMFKQQLKGIIATEQQLLLTEIAGSLDDKLSLAHAQLVSAATIVSTEALVSGDTAQDFLDHRPGLHDAFDNHIFLYSPEGRIIAESPFVPNRRGLDFSFRPCIKDTLATSVPVISDPYVSSQPHKHPVIMMTAPVFNQEGKIIAILGGSLDLMRPNILGKLSEKKIGKSGYLYLTTMDRVMVMHPDKDRILKKIPAGKNPLLDRALQGFEGTDENHSREGVPMLTSFKRLRVKNWLLAANYPQAEAYAPLIRAAEILLAWMLVIILAAFVVIRFFSQYLTNSLLAFTRHVEEIDAKRGEARLFHAAGGDETATLAKAFNVMLGKLDRQQEELRQSEEIYRTVTEFSFEFIFWRGPEKKMIFVSQNCRQFTGYSEEKFLADPGLLDELFHPEDRERWEHHVHPVDETGKLLALEFRIITRTGEVRWVSHICAEIHDETGCFLGWRGDLVDITERKLAEEEKDKLEIQFQQAQKMESVGRLAGGVAHDFNNMLGVIMGHTELALRQVDPASPLNAHLIEISKAAERSADLTRQLLAFARKQIVAPKALDLNEVVAGMLTMLQRLIGEDISLVWWPQVGLWPVRMDPSQFDQLLANLCINARDAIDDVGTITIETGHRVFDEAYCANHLGFNPGDYVRLAISDNGCGMDKEIVGHIFEPFFTTKGVGKGTGLGLATVYGVVKQNNGFVNVYSEPGQGTTFTIYLPRYVGNGAQVQTEQPAGPAIGGQETILLVEDEPAILRMTTAMLEGLGYTVLAADSPDQAMLLAQQHAGEIGLLMSDVIMPEMNGRDLANRLLSSLPRIKVLFMSGYTADIIAHHGVLEAGGAFVQKPFSMQELATTVRKVLNGA